MKQLRKMSVYILTVMLGVFVLSGIGKGNVSRAETTSDGFEYSVYDGNIMITKYTGTVTEVIIPAEIEGMPVTRIGGFAFKGSGFISITIPKSVTSIGQGVFSGCVGLENITVEKGNTVYDSRDNCNAIIETGSNTLIAGCKNTVIPEGVTSIGEFAFSGCSSLTSITIPEGVTSIGWVAFEDCSGLTSITIPSSMTSISSDAFNGCSGLTSIAVEKGNMVYDSRDNCNAIIETSSNTLIVGFKNTVIPEGVTSIENGAFRDCSGLTSITIPSSVTSIGNNAFNGCSGLTSIAVEKGNTVYDSRDNCNAIIETSSNTLILGCKNTVIPKGVTSIGGSAFNGCSGLTSITIPEGVTSIGQAAFENCIGLTSITIPKGVTSIEIGTFSSCSSLTSITIPEGVTSIGWSAFSHCSGLTSITIPEGVTSIGNFAFDECSGLTSVTIPSSLTEIGIWAFCSCSSLTSITIPEGVTRIGQGAFENCIGLTSVTFPSSLTAISLGSFSGCSGLTSITISEGVTGIGGGAFDGCSRLRSITIPSSLTFIEGNPFSGCSRLESIAVKKGNTAYDSRDNCNAIIETSSNTLIVGCKNTVIPSSVTSIRAVAFRECSGLTSITIPSSVTSIGDSAFDDVPKSAVFYVVPNSYAETYAKEKGYKTDDIKNKPADDKVEAPKKGTKVVDSKTKSTYEVTVSGKVSGGKVKGAEVAFKKANKSAKSVTIPATVKVDGVTYKVTSVKDNAFKNNTKLTKVTIGKNVTKIGKNAFYGCKNLKTITIKSTKLKSIGKNALKGINKKAQISVPKKQKAAYTKLIKKNTGYKSSMKIK